MCLFAKRVRVVCLSIPVWYCMVCCFFVLFAVFVCGVECVCGLLLVPYVKLSVFCAFLWAVMCLCVFVYDVSCGVVQFVCFCLSLCVWLFAL